MLEDFELKDRNETCLPRIEEGLSCLMVTWLGDCLLVLSLLEQRTEEDDVGMMIDAMFGV